MVDNPQNQGDSEPKENLEEEQEILKEKTDDVIRQQVIEKFELDDEIDKELIDKFVADRKESHKALSTAIRQKIGWREKATPKESDKGAKPEESQEPKYITAEEAEKMTDARLAKEKLNSLDLSDELKKEVESYAELHKCSINEAVNSPYISYRRDEEGKQAKIEGAGLGRTSHTGRAGSFSLEDMTDEKLSNELAGIDTSTPEGSKRFDEITAELKKRS